MKTHFPSAIDAGKRFPLLLRTTVGTVSGETVARFFLNIINLIEANGLIEKLQIPFQTSGHNNLIAYLPQHPNGKPFINYIQYEFSFNNKMIYINTNHPRFFAIRQGARLIDAVGIIVL